MNCRGGRLLWVMGVWSGMATSGLAEETVEFFRSHEVPHSGAGYLMTEKGFAPLGLHAALRAADMNGDGAMDLVVLADGAMPAGAYSGAEPPDGQRGHEMGPSHFLFGAVGGFSGSAAPSPNVVAGTIRGDPDGVRSSGGDLGWFENDGFGHFQYRCVENMSGGGSRTPRLYGGQQLETADVDDDGDPDLVVWCGEGRRTGTPPSEWGASRVAWFENRLPIGFYQHDILQGRDPAVGAIADMDRDGRMDIIVADRAGGNPALYWLKNDGASNAPLFGATNRRPVRLDGNVIKESGISALRAMDLDQDGDVDLVLVKGSSRGELLALFQEPNGSFRSLSIDSDVGKETSLTVLDINGDKTPDIAAGSGPVKMFLSKGGARWIPAALAGNDQITGAVDLRFADLNGDKRPDLLILLVNPLPSDPRQSALGGVWIQPSVPGPWNFYPFFEEGPRIPGAGDVGGGLAVADFDQDGDLDVVRAHRDFPLSFHENVWNTQRLFRLAATVQQPGFIQSVLSYVSSRPDGKPERRIGQGTTNQ